MGQICHCLCWVLDFLSSKVKDLPYYIQFGVHLSLFTKHSILPSSEALKICLLNLQNAIDYYEDGDKRD